MEFLKNSLLLISLIILGSIVMLIQSDSYGGQFFIGELIQGISFLFLISRIAKKKSKFLTWLFGIVILAVLLLIIAILSNILYPHRDSFLGGIWFFLLPYFFVVAVISLIIVLAVKRK
jgi:hypothetical protein